MSYVELINPYYHPEKIDAQMMAFEEPDMSYEYNTLAFWVTPDGKVFTGQDSGCSCPTPFEDNYAADTKEEVLQKLERVGSLEQALSTFDSWNKGYDGKPHLGLTDRNALTVWINDNLKK